MGWYNDTLHFPFTHFGKDPMYTYIMDLWSQVVGVLTQGIMSLLAVSIMAIKGPLTICLAKVDYWVWHVRGLW